jgi:hypothetical protein
LNYSTRTEKAYVYWARFFIRWHGLRHPREMGGTEVETFPSYLANERKGSVSTHHPAVRRVTNLDFNRRLIAMREPGMASDQPCCALHARHRMHGFGP